MDNWCEYVSQDGEVKHVLQFFCECEDLDETFTNLLSSSSEEKRDGIGNLGAEGSDKNAQSAWQKVLAVAQDRARVPWPGGAKRIDLGWFLAAALIWFLRWLAWRCTSLGRVIIIIFVCFAGLGYSHLRALRQSSNSQFHVAWLTLSVVGSYMRYRDSIERTLPWRADLIAHMSLLVMVASYLYCCIADPGRDSLAESTCFSDEGLRLMDNTNSSAAKDDALESKVSLRRQHQQQRSKILRSGRCRICKCTFRLRDHHCVWVGQCVAERNRRPFLLFLVLFSGLSLWFSGNMLKVTVMVDSDDESGIAEQAPLLWLRLVRLLVRDNRGGQFVAHSLYASIAGVLSMALATQQCILVGAGVTSLDLRRMGNNARYRKGVNKRSEDGSPAHPADLPQALQRLYASPVPDLQPTIRRAGLSLCPPLGEFCRNWVKFLTGTELLSPSMEPIYHLTEKLAHKQRRNPGKRS